MNKNRTLSATCGQPMLVALFALGLTSGAAFAQAPQGKPAVSGPSEPAPDAKPAAAPNSVEGVTVTGAKVLPKIGIPDDKAEAYAAQAAQDEAWRKYRQSTPPLTKNPNEMAKDYPGLQTFIPQ